MLSSFFPNIRLFGSFYRISIYLSTGFWGGAVVKKQPVNSGDTGSIPGSRRSPGVRNGNPLQYSCLENSTNRGAWWARVHGVSKSWTWLSTSMHTHTHLSLVNIMKYTCILTIDIIYNILSILILVYSLGKYKYIYYYSYNTLCVCVCVCVCVHTRAQSCPILCDPTDCSPPDSSAHGILQARILE